jgi:hypothetical protein
MDKRIEQGLSVEEEAALKLLDTAIAERETGVYHDYSRLEKSQKVAIEGVERILEAGRGSLESVEAAQKTLVKIMTKRTNSNLLRATGDLVYKNARQAQALLNNTGFEHNHRDLAEDSTGLPMKFDGPGQTLTGGALVKARAECASHCKMQGRTSCRYCMGEGFAAKSARENDPSHSVNKSKFQRASEESVLRRV